MLPIQTKLTNQNKKTTNGRTIQGIVIHAVGAVSSAKNNAEYYASKYLGSSAHYFCDQNEIWQSVQDKDVAWHCGTANCYTQKHPTLRNSNTIGIEMCQDTPSTVAAGTIKNTAELVRYLMNKYKIPVEKVVRHWDVVNKKCPSMYVDDAKWEALKAVLTGSVPNTNIQASNNNEKSYKYKVGDRVIVSTHYVGPNDPIEKHVVVNPPLEMEILNVISNAKNPYYTNFDSYINDGDIRGHASSVQEDSKVKKNTFNQHIHDLQWALNQDGFTDAQGRWLKEDGIWGSNTAAAVGKVCLSTKTKGKYTNVTSWVQCRVGTLVDGLYGFHTKNAVCVFQSNHDIIPDGIVGRNTILTIVNTYIG